MRVASRPVRARIKALALDLSPVDCASQATGMAIVDVLPQQLPLPSVADIATASPSQKEFDAEQARDSHYDTA